MKLISEKKIMNQQPLSKRELKVALMAEIALIQKIKKADALGQRKKADWLTQLYFRTHYVHRTAVHEANKRLKLINRVPKEKLPAIAAKLDPFRGTDEPVVVNFKEKVGGPNQIFRPIMNFGIENWANQFMVQRILEARGLVHENQYAVRGGGTAGAVQVHLTVRSNSRYRRAF